jgi:hypothetical protein
MYSFFFFKNGYIVHVVFSIIKENQNISHVHIFNNYTNIHRYKRVFTQKLWEELVRQVMYPIKKHVFSFLKNYEIQQPLILSNMK